MDRFVDLWDYRARVVELYRHVREGTPSEQTHQAFREARDALFATHPQSALDAAQKARFHGLDYFPYDPSLRFVLPLEPAPPATLEFETADDGLVRAERFARVRFRLEGVECVLSLYWLLGYGGGVFLPFRDATSGLETYGGGRYLLDTIKGADLGHSGSTVTLDFNCAYNPSCAYNERWSCPLAPPENRLTVPIRAGEKTFSS